MDGNLDISIDKLPVKRLEVIEENGVERFLSDVGHEEKRVNLIKRTDFKWAAEREEPSSKKQKKNKTSGSTKETQSSSNQPWLWRSVVENLQLAHQELSVIIDLINTRNVMRAMVNNPILIESVACCNFHIFQAVRRQKLIKSSWFTHNRKQY